MSQLSIVIPSRRPLQTARFALETALIYAKKCNAVMIVSDNSGDAKKAEWLASLGPRVRRLDSDAPDAVSNLLHALRAVETPFLMPMGDDDAAFVMDGLAPMSLASLPGDVVAVRPQTVTWADERGVTRRATFAFDGETPSARLDAYMRHSGGNNALYYSLYRTDIFRDLWFYFRDYHPTRGAYADWAFVYAFLSCGKFLHDPALLYLYDVAQWQREEDLNASLNALFTAVGLPLRAADLMMLLTFVDWYGFLCWAGLPLTAADRREASLFCARSVLGSFVKRVETDPDRYSPLERNYCQSLKRMNDAHEAFHAALPILDALKPGLGEGYRRFAEVGGLIP